MEQLFQWFGLQPYGEGAFDMGMNSEILQLSINRENYKDKGKGTVDGSMGV